MRFSDMKKTQEINTNTKRAIPISWVRLLQSKDVIITIYLSSLILLTIMVASCNKAIPNEAQVSFIFGISETEHCTHDCNKYFALIDEKLFEASGSYKTPLVIASQPLPDKFSQKAIELWQTFPDQLMEKPYQTFGNVSEKHAGKLYLEYRKSEDVYYKWILDIDTNQIESPLRSYVQKTINTTYEIKP